VTERENQKLHSTFEKKERQKKAEGVAEQHQHREATTGNQKNQPQKFGGRSLEVKLVTCLQGKKKTIANRGSLKQKKKNSSRKKKEQV